MPRERLGTSLKRRIDERKARRENASKKGTYEGRLTPRQQTSAYMNKPVPGYDAKREAAIGLRDDPRFSTGINREAKFRDLARERIRRGLNLGENDPVYTGPMMQTPVGNHPGINRDNLGADPDNRGLRYGAQNVRGERVDPSRRPRAGVDIAAPRRQGSPLLDRPSTMDYTSGYARGIGQSIASGARSLPDIARSAAGSLREGVSQLPARARGAMDRGMDYAARTRARATDALNNRLANLPPALGEIPPIAHRRAANMNTELLDRADNMGRTYTRMAQHPQTVLRDQQLNNITGPRGYGRLTADRNEANRLGEYTWGDYARSIPGRISDTAGEARDAIRSIPNAARERAGEIASEYRQGDQDYQPGDFGVAARGRLRDFGERIGHYAGRISQGIGNLGGMISNSAPGRFIGSLRDRFRDFRMPRPQIPRLPRTQEESFDVGENAPEVTSAENIGGESLGDRFMRNVRAIPGAVSRGVSNLAGAIGRRANRGTYDQAPAAPAEPEPAPAPQQAAPAPAPAPAPQAPAGVQPSSAPLIGGDPSASRVLYTRGQRPSDADVEGV